MSFCVNTIVGQNYDFKSYHLYTNGDDKYSPTNALNDDAKVCIDETKQKIELSLYNSNEKKWKSFSLKIDYFVDLGIKTKIGKLYVF